jgi:hypothetical protein
MHITRTFEYKSPKNDKNGRKLFIDNIIHTFVNVLWLQNLTFLDLHYPGVNFIITQPFRYTYLKMAQNT